MGPSLLSPATAFVLSTLTSWCFQAPFFGIAQALSVEPVPSPNLDLSQLGRVALTGDFDSISLYTYNLQNEDGFSTNGSQSLFTQLPDGTLASLTSADAGIQTMCPFILKDGTFAGVVAGGNFTSLGGVEAQGIALFDPNTTKVTPLPGLTGRVSAVLCDQKSNTVYVGGDFKGGNSTNAIAWVGMTGWANLPFAGFNGPVSSIIQAPGGNIIFGGSFDGLGNASTAPNKKDEQIINISKANISTATSTTTAGFSDPKNIACGSDGQDGSGHTWLLADNAPGWWKADFGFGFRPTKLRLWNTRQDGRGTKIFRFNAFPINGILNLTYTDPKTGRNESCDAWCPLASETEEGYQDFHFVNVIGMSSFRLDILDWYGGGGGLNGIQLFQDDIYAFAIEDFNEASCAGISQPSNATVTGPWAVTPSRQSSSEYLSANLTGPSIDSSSASVVFRPDIRQSGNYSVTVWTPGCLQDDSCAQRGRVNITGTMASQTRQSAPVQTEIYQTNNYDKYDQVYYGHVDAGSDSFQPSITLTPSANQGDNLYIVAQRVRFELVSSTDGLNGLYEFDPNQASATTDYSNSTVDRAGMDLDSNASITSLSASQDTIYVAGNFSNSNFDNVFAISQGNATSLPHGGLNGQVLTTYLTGNSLYVGGVFNNTSKANTADLNHIAVFSTQEKAWQPLGAGVNGRVDAIVPLTLNVTANKPELVISISGDFDEILPFDKNLSRAVSGLAVWVPSQKNWLQNLGTQAVSISGRLTAGTNLPNGPPLFAGAVASQGLGVSGAVELSTSGALGLSQLPIDIEPHELSSTSLQKRASTAQNVSGAVTGFFYESGGVNVTVLGGHFAARASNGSLIHNLAFINGSNSDKVTGLGAGINSDSAVLALETQGSVLFAGGTLTGEVDGNDVNGLILYDLAQSTFVDPQPPAFAGSNVAVNAIATRPGSGDVYVGGNFESAGSLGCPSVCIFTTSASQWNTPGSGLTGTVTALTWSGKNRLIASGSLNVNGNSTTMAVYDANQQTWTSFDQANTLPGPISALTAANNAQTNFWAAGQASNGSTFLSKYDGSKWRVVQETFGQSTVIRGLQILSLSKNHAGSDLVDADQVLLITGQLSLPNFGNASAALFNGTAFSPFILANKADNQPGSLSQIFSQKQNYFKSGGGHLAVGFVVLIALAIALALIFVLVVIGIVAERLRRKREGYVPAPTQMFDKHSNMDRIPPEHLFGNLGRGARGPGDAPMI
ncbi:hypothetical protein L228DRAFT_215896 [Xylona heveae TC161]|uniref:Cellular morphogenesis protein n=1 Tax=Xylona heveae (strain CBS 132557 / TC161) TaxID=1328760 RepID=A0A165J833_XYLHT|nr:hypothetical protein L228DRAFT_215896 [Xylona heveae TC161]KZF25874.1 hypothetical protein L228DRAFT_215896 [Xylona heveae TC161]